MSAQVIQNYALYNKWANEQFLEWMLSLPDDILTAESASSFNSIRSTLLHMWGAEHGWLTTLKKEAWSLPYSKEKFDGNANSLIQSFHRTTQQFTAHALSLSENQLSEKVETKNGKAMEVADILLHVVNHASYHRGQIVSIARSFGVCNAPRTDYIYFKA